MADDRVVRARHRRRLGAVSLAVSFSLALYVAMRSRRATWRNGGELAGRLLRLFRERPGEFFLPPKAA